MFIGRWNYTQNQKDEITNKYAVYRDTLKEKLIKENGISFEVIRYDEDIEMNLEYIISKYKK